MKSFNCLNKILHIFCVLTLGIFIIEVKSFTPKGRVGHSSVLVGTQLYFFGGSLINGFSSDEVFYLDVSQPFNITSPPFTDLTESAKIPFGSQWASMSLINNNDDPIVYLIGGLMLDPVSNEEAFISNVHTFNTKTLEWKIPYIKGKTPERRRHAKAVNDDAGLIYIFGGIDGPQNNLTTSYNETLILDTTNLLWDTIYLPNNRFDYSATILKNGIILYIGGLEKSTQSSSQLIDIDQINIYDTKLGIWSLMTVKNISLIESRYYHSAVLAPDGNTIVVYGGTKNAAKNINVEHDVVILNTQETPYEWTVPLKISSNIVEEPSLHGHTADLVGNYMIVAFGNNTNTGSFNSNIYIMDIRNYTWIDAFEVNTTNPSLPTPETPSSDVFDILIGVLIGVIGIIILCIVGTLCYQWRNKEKQKEVISHNF